MNRILNLANLNESEIIYEISKFPDGQQDLKITGGPIPMESVTIKSHFQSFKDLELIICAKKSLDGMGVSDVNLYIPYMLGARSDRRFSNGGNSYLKDVVAPIINSLGFKLVTCFDPHSDVSEAVINNFSKERVDLFYTWAKTHLSKNFIVLSPDAGSLKKIYDVAKIMECQNIVVCSKHRDLSTGKITHTEVPIRKHETGIGVELVIIDDICDGGRTFIQIVEVIRALGLNNKITLIVSHGIFSAGTEILFKNFDKILCTNSYNSPAQVTERFKLL
jgi:ribose-phosphate pyrophosphokinase